MKFTVDLEDFWLEEDGGEIEDQLKQHITHSVVCEIKTSIQNQINAEITKLVLAQVEESLVDVIQEQIAECIEAGVINRHGSHIKITDHVNQMFESSNSWSCPDRKLESLTKAFAEDFKSQYNAVFATKVVQSMQEQGLLKDEVVKILLEGK